MAALQGQVGPAVVVDGNTPPIRLGHTAEVIVGEGRLPTAEQASRGLVFAACVPPGTGVAPGTAIGTTASFCLANPANSGINLVLYQITAGYILGTLGAGTLALLAHQSASGAIVLPSGTAITPTGLLLGANKTGQGKASFTTTVPAAGLMIDAIGSLGASLATTAVAPWQIQRNYGGAIIIGPGSAVSVQGIAAAGTSPLITIGAIWVEENP